MKIIITLVTGRQWGIEWVSKAKIDLDELTKILERSNLERGQTLFLKADMPGIQGVDYAISSKVTIRRLA